MPVQSPRDAENLKAGRLLAMDPGSSSPISPSFSIFSPSPYIINCKKRERRDSLIGGTWEGRCPHEMRCDGGQGQERFVPNSWTASSRFISLNDQLVELKNALEKFISDCSSSAVDGAVGLDFQALRKKNVRGKILAEILSSRKLATLNDESTKATSSVGVEDECRSSSGSPTDEFFDARDASSSEGYSSNEDKSIQSQRRSLAIESDLVRQLHVEIKTRMQMEEALHIMQQCQQNIVNILLSPACTTTPGSSSPQPVSSTTFGNHGLASLIEEDWQDENCLRLRTVIATVISSALLQGTITPDEAEALEKLLETKDRESCRLKRKLKFFEHVNHELSRKNQEATERARRIRHSRQKWIRSLAIGIAAGMCGTLIYWYLPWERWKSAKKEVHASSSET